MQMIYRQLHKDHPFIQMIKGCLDFPVNRLGIREVQELLEQARTEIGNDGFNTNKLQLIRAVREKQLLIQQYQSHQVSTLLYMYKCPSQSFHLNA